MSMVTPILTEENTQLNLAEFPAHLFRGYDIRGPVIDFTPEVVERAGKAFAKLTGAGRVAIGFDMRASTPMIVTALTKGITSMGADVVNIGMTTTPMLYATVGMTDDIDAGIMVTASHCDSSWNGIKMCRGDVSPIAMGSGMEELRDLARSNAFSMADTVGSVERLDMSDKIIDTFFESAGDMDVSDMSVVLDAGNAVSSIYLPRVMEHLGCEHTDLFFELDESFPNHEANPLKLDTLKTLSREVVEKGADIGFAFDGDADRIGIVDEKGVPVPSDVFGTILALSILEDEPGALIMGDIRNTRDMKKQVEMRGGKYGVVPVGHANIKREMRLRGPIFAAELSGHLYFKSLNNEML